LSREELKIVFVGRCDSARVARVDVEGGRVNKLEFEDKEVFSVSKYKEWSSQFPYGYSGIKDPMNLFYKSTDGLGLTLSGSTPTLLVMDSSLQQLPPNLVRVGDDFAGRTIPIASAPSMSWLWAVRKSLQTRSQSRKAWIPTDVIGAATPTLAMVSERLQDCLKEHQIDLNTSAELPDDLAESELVVIVAHGGIFPEGRFLQRVSDDANSAMYLVTLAAAIRDSSLCILFICSGGRIDTHPMGETTVGLVKEVMDQGCSTVIASPWPLNVAVPPHWLPVFLQEWMAGQTAIQAAFLANKNVEKKLGDSPLDCLAMNVFGDPLRKKS
jgi:hypothetical protein